MFRVIQRSALASAVNGMSTLQNVQPTRSSNRRYLIANKSKHCSNGSDYCRFRRDRMEVTVFEEILGDPAERIW